MLQVLLQNTASFANPTSPAEETHTVGQITKVREHRDHTGFGRSDFEITNSSSSNHVVGAITTEASTFVMAITLHVCSSSLEPWELQFINKLMIEKSALDVKPTAWVVISASILNLSH